MEEITSPLKAIRAKCMDCSNDSYSEIANCPVTNCPLWPFRMGKNPYRKKKELSEEQKAKLLEGLAKARESKQN